MSADNTQSQQIVKRYSRQEVSQHNKYKDLWVIINNNVYDLSKFADFHPAGRNVLIEYAGKDVTNLYKQFHAESVMHKYHDKLFIGVLNEDVPVELNFIQKIPGAFGDGIPHADPPNLQGWHSPYYNQTHRDLRKGIREYLQKNMEPYVDEWDMQKKIPIDKMREIGEQGCFALIVGQPWPEKYFPKKEVCGVPIDKFDYFHEIVLIEEAIKYSSNGVIWGMGIVAIAMPPLLNYGSEELKSRYCSKILSGEKLIALAVTEPWAGSDVAGIKTTAVLSECGKFYIVNGMKKFITTGAYADCFTTAVRTDENKYFGVSLLMIDRTMPGVKTRAMNVQGAWGSGTGFIIFENVKVPVENLIGDEGCAFLYIMKNFNHERFQITIECVAASRVMVEECLKYTHLRKTFGKRLIDQPVIRQKLARMIADVETMQAQLELIAYNFQRATEKHDKVLAGAIAIAKASSTLVLEKTCNEAMQIFGGNGYQRGSVGSKVERYFRDCKSLTLGGGTPEVMFDMSIRMSGGLMPKVKKPKL